MTLFNNSTFTKDKQLFNLGKMEYIETGGSGENIDSLPSLLDRLRGLK